MWIRHARQTGTSHKGSMLPDTNIRIYANDTNESNSFYSYVSYIRIATSTEVLRGASVANEVVTRGYIPFSQE